MKRIMVPPSKSVLHREMILAALFGELDKVKIDLSDCSRDVYATYECLKTLEPVLKTHGNKIGENNLSFYVGESGSTLRFLIPVLGALGVEGTITGEEPLKKRPLKELLEVCEKHGMKFNSYQLPISFQGQLLPGDYEITGSVSSQYISGLLFALPLLKEKSSIHIKDKLESKPYVDLTIFCMKKYGIQIHEFVEKDEIKPGQLPRGYDRFCFEVEANGYNQKNTQCFEREIVPEGDWSNVAPFLVYGNFCQDCEFKGVKKDSIQGDREILQILQENDGLISWNEDVLAVKARGDFGVETIPRIEKMAKSSEDNGSLIVDCAQIPDLFPILAVYFALLGKTVCFTGVERLHGKESDRVKSTLSLLEGICRWKMEAKIQKNDEKPQEYLTLQPIDFTINSSAIHLREVDSFHDHRIVMAATVLFAVLSQREIKGFPSSMIIKQGVCVDKSYPKFFEDFIEIAGKEKFNVELINDKDIVIERKRQ